MKKLYAMIAIGSFLLSSSLYCIDIKQIFKDVNQFAKSIPKKAEKYAKKTIDTVKNIKKQKGTITNKSMDKLTLKLFFKDAVDPIIITVEGKGTETVPVPAGKCLEKIKFGHKSYNGQVNIEQCTKKDFAITIDKVSIHTDTSESYSLYFYRDYYRITVTVGKKRYEGATNVSDYQA